MSVALSRPSGRPNMPGKLKLSKIFIVHELLDEKGILSKYETLVAFLSNFNFCQKLGVALPRPSGWPDMPEKNSEFFIDH